ncbi:sigma-54-dependent transcriptional regulator [Janthinobacterium psychrotolerans]|uniref:DNA-binding transcriptional response regulator, NtrC family n=1 Tax=Janthinobacterium psychrotolerans TaxID=1747903 RepID=A0A1A7CB56_9BURK|nr:sigma-54 dependent transcriptional regulator [Janthinobacterium psychrotolerans]OBV41538.1 DNA-binding transcriptional response regulator, NtrC family [Janthinobacterium psychrotolerans]
MAMILIVDDDTAFRDTLAEALCDLDYQVSQAASCEAGLRRLQAGGIDLAIVDLRLPGDNGLAFLRAAPALAPGVPCIMLTAYAVGSNTIEAMRLGAFDHLTKPIGRETLAQTLARALRTKENDTVDTSAMADTSQAGEQMLSNSEVMRAIFKRIGLVADSDNSVLVLGETGTGKELVAQALHANSARKAGPFVAVNCAAIPADLLESELFGHVKGAFSGATAERAGRFREADGGTLFLDEIGDMALPTQAKILRVLQEREVTPLGGRHALPVDLRIVAATHRDIEADVAADAFRADLWYRLQVITIHLPPLRERPEDIDLLAAHFLQQGGNGRAKRLSGAALAALRAHGWPGNVRELRNTMQRAIALSEGELIEAGHLGLNAARASQAQTATTAAPPGDIDWDGPLDAAVATLEAAMLLRALAACAGNRSQAARRLGLSRQQLYRKLAQYGLE